VSHRAVGHAVADSELRHYDKNMTTFRGYPTHRCNARYAYQASCESARCTFALHEFSLLRALAALAKEQCDDLQFKHWGAW
jgi:hypothetical protein